MAGITDLDELLGSLDPELHPLPWVYAVVPEIPAAVEPFAVVREQEGVTLVLTVDEAARLGLPVGSRFALITLRVHSALEAVGMTAAFARVLADAGMSCNVVAGFHHDHLLVPWARGAEAVDLLRGLAERPSGP